MNAAPDPILEVEHLSMQFGGLLAIADLSFTARRGEITALIGPNGAGKTTVFNCITGFYRPSSGMMRLVHADGTTFLLERELDFRISKRAKVARTFQNIRLFPGMTVLENLLVAQHQVLMKASGFTFLGLFGIPVYARAESAAIDKASYWLDRIGLLRRADDPARDLPYGQQRRLEVARAPCTQPALLCPDEAAAGVNRRVSAASAPAAEAVQGSEPLLGLRGVKAYYGSIIALKGVDIDVYDGEIVALIGANGAGKSTLMMTIFGNPRAREGRIVFAGRDITQLPTHEIARLKIAQAPEGRRIFVRMTVLENLQMGAVVADGAQFQSDVERG